MWPDSRHLWWQNEKGVGRSEQVRLQIELERLPDSFSMVDEWEDANRWGREWMKWGQVTNTTHTVTFSKGTSVLLKSEVLWGMILCPPIDNSINYMGLLVGLVVHQLLKEREIVFNKTEDTTFILVLVIPTLTSPTPRVTCKQCLHVPLK